MTNYKYGKKFVINNLNLVNENDYKSKKNKEHNNHISKCFFISEQSLKKIIHVVMTRFLIEFREPLNIIQKVGHERFILNGIRVMKKYLLPSLENQSCKQFIWMLLVGDKANTTYIENLLIKKYH